MREKILEIVDEVSSNQDLSEGEQGLEIATQIMYAIRIPQHQKDVGEICDLMTELGSTISNAQDPEKLAPEQLERSIAAGQTSREE